MKQMKSVSIEREGGGRGYIPVFQEARVPMAYSASFGTILVFESLTYFAYVVYIVTNVCLGAYFLEIPLGSV